MLGSEVPGTRRRVTLANIAEHSRAGQALLWISPAEEEIMIEGGVRERATPPVPGCAGSRFPVAGRNSP